MKLSLVFIALMSCCSPLNDYQRAYVQGVGCLTKFDSFGRCIECCGEVSSKGE